MCTRRRPWNGHHLLAGGTFHAPAGKLIAGLHLLAAPTGKGNGH
jgi:hypothetical protein